MDWLHASTEKTLRDLAEQGPQAAAKVDSNELHHMLWLYLNQHSDAPDMTLLRPLLSELAKRLADEREEIYFSDIREGAWWQLVLGKSSAQGYQDMVSAFTDDAERDVHLALLCRDAMHPNSSEN